MDLLKTLLVYMSLAFSTSVMTAPQPSDLPQATILPTATPFVATASPTPEPTMTPTPTQIPDPTITPSAEYKTLSVGSRGENVKKLQRRLAELGYLTDTVDGAYGNQTKRAVERFQYYNGLYVDGIAGQRTQTILYESHEVVFAPVDVTPPPTDSPAPPPTPTVAPTQTPAPVVTATQPPEATATAVVTDAPTETPEPAVTATQPPEATATMVVTDAPPTDAPPTEPAGQEPEPSPQVIPVVVEGSQILANGAAQALVDEEGRIVPYRQTEQGEILLPFTTMARLLGWATAVVEEENPDLYTVMAGEYLLQIAYDRDEAGAVSHVGIQVDSLPVELAPGQAWVVEGELLLSPSALETLINAEWSLEAEPPIITILFPAKDEDGDTAAVG